MNIMNINTLSTDKFGNPYSGPRTYAETRALIFGEYDTLTKREALDLADTIADAGYTGVAARVRKLVSEWN